MSPDAKRVLRKPHRWTTVDRTDFLMALVCTHVAALLIGYFWGHP